MILRRVATHLRQQHWTAIFIEFLIVVAGVFLGTQVSNWNTDRLDHQRAHSYIERIHDDLRTDLATYRDRMDFWGKVSAYGRAGLAYAENGDAGGRSQWELLLAYFQASQVAEFYATATTYTELQSAGELGLIEDVGLRSALVQYYTYSGNVVLTERPVYRIHVRGMIPLDVQDYVWTHCYETDAAAQTLHSCPAPISEARAGAIVNVIRRNRELMDELRYWMSTMTVAENIGRARIAQANQMQREVETALRR